MHHGGADLQAAGAQQQKLGCIPPGDDAAHARDRHFRSANHVIRSERGQHVQRDRLDRRTGVSAVATLAADTRGDFEACRDRPR